MGLVYNLYPLGTQGLDNSQSIGKGDLYNELDEQIANEIKLIANGFL